jgi:acetyltransferase-like isoleucine patch superfamily enzyme
MLKKFWNNQLLGIPAAFLLLMQSVINKAINNLLTIVYSRGFGKCGQNVVINIGFSCRYPGNIFLENNVLIDRGSTFSVESANNFIIKEGVSIGRRCFIDFTGGVIINERSHLAENVKILTHDHGYDYNSIPIGKSLEIGKNVFIGMDSIILHNVRKIGDNAVIGIGSIVTKDVPENAIVAGNPARIIKYRADVSQMSEIS